MRETLLRATALSSGLAALVAGTPAMGQTAGPTPAQPQEGSSTRPDAAAETGTEDQAQITVTGSRITRRDFSADSPIVSIGQTAIQNVGPATLEQVLNEMPQFTAIRPGSTLTASRQGRNNANLRGLGIARTLVLLDGRRMQPSDTLGTIDLNTIPSALIGNVEVITGGASAVYGSDAIAGVVNFRLRRDFTGLELDGQYGITERGDSATREFNVTFGGNFADGRGHIDLSLGYLDRERSLRGARPYFIDSGIASNLTGALILADAANLPSTASLAGVFGRYGGPTPVRNATLSANTDGTLFTPSSPVLNYRAQDGGIYSLVNGRVGIPYGETYALQTPLERYSVFARATYDVTDGIEAFAQVSHVQYTTEFNVFGGSVRELTIPITNPFIPGDLRPILASRPSPNAPLIYNFSSGRVARAVTATRYNVDQYLLGLRGRLGLGDFRWEIYGSYGRTDQDSRISGQIDRTAINTLLNAADGGASRCAGGFNPFSSVIAQSDSAQQACYNYLVRTLRAHTEFDQHVAEATIQGGLVSLPAGDVRIAVGAGYRRNRFDDQPASEIVNGTVVNAVVGQIVPASGAITVREVFAEALIPLIHDTPLIQRLEIDLAYRLSHYSSIGSAHTYKATADWQMFDFLRLRGGAQQAIRAPSLGEIFTQDGGGQGLIGSTASGQGDPCDVTGVYRAASNPNAAQVRTLCIANGVPASVIDIFRFSGSRVQTRNPISLGLREESARTYTAGVVITSPWSSPLLSRLSLSVDYYNITVKDAIGTITAPINLSQCFSAVGNPTFSAGNIFCQQVRRDAGGNISEVLTPRLNLGSYKTSGIDFQLDWSANLADLGVGRGSHRLGLNLLVSYLDSYAIQNFAGLAFIDYAGTIGNGQIDEFTISYPRWKVSGTLNLDTGPMSLSFKARWIDALYNSADAGAAAHTRPGSAARVYFDLTARFRVSDAFEVRFGVLNIADMQPPVFIGEGATDLAIYDMLGRRFFAGVRAHF
jgi:iron complex outermembrane receptor protein